MFRRTTTSVSVLGLAFLCSPPAQAQTRIDHPARVFQSVVEGDIESSRSLALPIDDLNELSLVVDHYRFEGDYFTMDGSVEGMPDAKFLLQGNSERISGWIAFRKAGFAYRYRTVGGEVTVEDVPFSRICPDCDRPPPRRAASSTPAVRYALTVSAIVKTWIAIGRPWRPSRNARWSCPLRAERPSVIGRPRSRIEAAAHDASLVTDDLEVRYR